MQLLGRNYLEHENTNEFLYPDTGTETGQQLCAEDGVEALCEAVESGGRVPSWVRAAACAVRENRRHLIAAASVLVIGFAVYLNWTMAAGESGIIGENSGGTQIITPQDVSASGDAPDMEGTEDDYFAVSQINRQRARDEAIAVLQDVVDGAENLSDVQSDAFAQISRIASDIEKEAAIESLVRGKGFSDCVAVISGELASVIVRTPALLPNEVAQIQEIVYETAGILPVNLKIIEK